jgi:hypothetical protein
MNHVMIDIETLSHKSNGVIISIGAVYFDINTGETGNQFYINIDPQSCIDMGLTMSASTVMWWLSQDKAAINKLMDRQDNLITALHELALFIQPDTYLWGNSARFDLGMLNNAYDACNLPLPWKYWQERDVRTLVSFNPDLKKSIVNDLPHDAISDCLYQIRYCSAIWNSININIETLKNQNNG